MSCDQELPTTPSEQVWTGNLLADKQLVPQSLQLGLRAALTLGELVRADTRAADTWRARVRACLESWLGPGRVSPSSLWRPAPPRRRQPRANPESARRG